jgi:hypothetical protein
MFSLITMRPDAMPSERPLGRWFQTRTAKSVLCQIRTAKSVLSFLYLNCSLSNQSFAELSLQTPSTRAIFFIFCVRAVLWLRSLPGPSTRSSLLSSIRGRHLKFRKTTQEKRATNPLACRLDQMCFSRNLINMILMYIIILICMP